MPSIYYTFTFEQKVSKKFKELKKITMKKILFYLISLSAFTAFSQSYFRTSTNPFSSLTNISHLKSITLGSTYESINDPWREVSGRFLELYKSSGNVSMRIGNSQGKLIFAIAGSNGAFHPLAETGDIVILKQTTDKVFFSLNNTNNDGNSAFIFGDDVNLSTLSILNNGRVGIGTANPDSELAVNGTIHSKKVRVDLNGWSDFVFSKDYQLPTLNEVERHIKEKGHLKDIPSAIDVIKNGIDLGKMDAKLLQKIEELTLYTIKQQKLIEQMQKEIFELKNKN